MTKTSERLSERLTSPEMVEAVARAMADQQLASRVEYKRRVGYHGRLSLARAALDAVCEELGVPDSLDHLGAIGQHAQLDPEPTA